MFRLFLLNALAVGEGTEARSYVQPTKRKASCSAFFLLCALLVFGCQTHPVSKEHRFCASTAWRSWEECRDRSPYRNCLTEPASAPNKPKNKILSFFWPSPRLQCYDEQAKCDDERDERMADCERLFGRANTPERRSTTPYKGQWDP